MVVGKNVYIEKKINYMFYCKPSQLPMVGKVIDPIGEPSTSISLNQFLTAS